MPDLVDPERVYPARDPDGARVLAKPNLTTWLRAVPWLLRFFDNRVPDDFYAESVDENGDFQIIIACPCGVEPTLHFGGMAACDCGRCYMHDGREIRTGRAEPEQVVD